MSKAEARKGRVGVDSSQGEGTAEPERPLSEREIARLRAAALTMVDVPRFKLPDSVIVRLVR